MSEKYDEIMEYIEVTEDMRQRILQNIQKSDSFNMPKVVRYPYWKRYVFIAACFAIILAGGLAAPTFLNPQIDLSVPDKDLSDLVQGSGAIVECDSVENLAQTVGFSVSGLSDLPFDVTEITYISYWATMAEINYYGSNGECAVYRKSLGTEDNSGQYTEYPDVKELTLNGLSVTLKGTDGRYELAWWTNGEYSYSVCFSQGITQTGWEPMISELH